MNIANCIKKIPYRKNIFEGHVMLQKKPLERKKMKFFFYYNGKLNFVLQYFWFYFFLSIVIYGVHIIKHRK